MAPEIVDRLSFMKKFTNLDRREFLLIDWAYDLAKLAHRGQVRDSGERYFEHVRRVALILADICHITDYRIICMALLHDVGEDTVGLGNRKVWLPYDNQTAYDQWMEVAYFRLQQFGDFVAKGVIALTKPDKGDPFFGSRENAHRFYMDRLWDEDTPPEVVLVKMADRLDNLRSLVGNTEAKQQKTVLETRADYIDLFTQRVVPNFPFGAQLLEQIGIEMAKYEK